MSFRGRAAIVGVGETLHKRVWAGRTERGLCAEAATMAIADAGLHKDDIDGIITFGGTSFPGPMAEYIGLKPGRFAAGSSMWGASSAVALVMAASAIHAGLVENVICVFGGGRDPAARSGIHLGGAPAGGSGGRDVGGGSQLAEFQAPYGQAVAANTGYGWLYSRHMFEYGTKQEQLARLAVNQRISAQKNPNSAFLGQLITVEDVLNSRYVNYPLHLLECVMPVAGAAAFIVTSAEHAKALPNRPVYVLGAGVHIKWSSFYNWDHMTEMPCRHSAQAAYDQAGYAAKDMQFAEFYD